MRRSRIIPSWSFQHVIAATCCYNWWKNLKSVDETVGEKNVSGKSGSFLNTWVPKVGERKRAKAKQGETETRSAGQHVNINMGEVD